jgi:hypothetical protein
MEAVQRKMNIYGKYLPLIARFSMELADQKRMPHYRALIGTSPEDGEKQEKEEREEASESTGESVTPNGETSEESNELEQKKIDEYSRS